MTSRLESAPVVCCYDTGTQYVLWCRYCRSWHLHGRLDGHRYAHCYSDSLSPYADGGYVLRCVGKASKAIIRDMARRRPKGVIA